MKSNACSLERRESQVPRQVNPVNRKRKLVSELTKEKENPKHKTLQVITHAALFFVSTPCWGPCSATLCDVILSILQRHLTSHICFASLIHPSSPQIQPILLSCISCSGFVCDPKGIPYLQRKLFPRMQ